MNQTNPRRNSEDREGGSRLLRRSPKLARDKKLRGDGELVAHIDRGHSPNVASDLVLDVSAFLLTADNKVPYRDERYCVFYGEHLSTDHSTRYVEDVDGRGEFIKVTLAKVDEEVSKIVFAVSIYDADDLAYTFSSIPEAHFWIEGPFVGGAAMEEVYSDNLSEHFASAKAVVTGEIHRHEDGWRYLRLGQTFSGLKEIGTLYGVNFEEE